MNLSTKLIPQFKHNAPEGTFYQVQEFKRNIFSIWICYKKKFDYNNGKPVKCCWGFYDYKKCKFFAPVNSSTVGKEVKFDNTRAWSSMPINTTGVEAFFV